MSRSAVFLDLYQEIAANGPKIVSRDQMGEPGWMSGELDRRDEFVKNFSWAVPSRAAIDQIASFADRGQILEVGSGSGLWAALLRQAGAEVIATDRCPPGKTFTLVQKLDALEAAASYPAAGVLMLCWPPYWGPMASEALEKFQGPKLVYVGEPTGGCTGDGQFFELLERDWVTDGPLDISQWWGIHDFLWLYRRRP